MKEIDKRLSIISKACEDKKAFDIKILGISELSSIGDYFVIASGNSTTQVAAIADEVEEKMEESGFEILQKEGQNSARWILLDYGDIIIHIFHRDDRKFYDLERLWADSEKIEL
ncbi:ribosome silencing factor [Anaerosalibacter massiliensis]|uniref:Ribosomal silencing factor RsfS n=1 Tax=Anaerosalibacter massiliensis TaxID=1347392 RepID=A0A9X2MJ41_9FIRM|nr:ribosome silencing factor [Anaerosalibacter massiliensis]MCR2044988.1 ribosome silencing factor [Anaerosalibacter massiliensis]